MNMYDIKPEKPETNTLYPEDIDLDKHLVFFRQSDRIYVLCNPGDGYRWVTGSNRVWEDRVDEVLENIILFPWEAGADIKCIKADDLNDTRYYEE